MLFLFHEMEIEEIPSDKLVTMTPFWHRAFNAVGCDPMCHCCNKMIPVNNLFKLSTIEEATRIGGECSYFQKEVLLGNMKPVSKDYRTFYKETIRPEFKDFDTKKYNEQAEEYKLESKPSS